MKRADIRRQNRSVLIINASCLFWRGRSRPPLLPLLLVGTTLSATKKEEEKKEREEKLRRKRRVEERGGRGVRAKKGRSLSKQSAGTVQLLISARLCRNKKDRLDSSAMTQLYECTSKSVRLATTSNLPLSLRSSLRRTWLLSIPSNIPSLCHRCS